MIDNNLSVLMGARRINARDLAKATGLDYGTILSMQSGKTGRFDAHVLAKLCEYFNVGIGDLLVYVPDKSSEQDGSKQGVTSTST